MKDIETYGTCPEKDTVRMPVAGQPERRNSSERGYYEPAPKYVPPPQDPWWYVLLVALGCALVAMLCVAGIWVFIGSML